MLPAVVPPTRGKEPGNRLFFVEIPNLWLGTALARSGRQVLDGMTDQMKQMVRNLKIEFHGKGRFVPAVRHRSRPAELAEHRASPAHVTAVSLCAVAFVDGRGVAVSRNGVVTPNHPDMTWLMQTEYCSGL